MDKEEIRQEVHSLIDQLKTVSDLRDFKLTLKDDLKRKGVFGDQIMNKHAEEGSKKFIRKAKNKEDLRKEVHSLLDRLERTSDLKLYRKFMKMRVKSKGNFWDELTQEQKDSIDKAIAELDRGEGIPYEEVRKEIRKRYNI